MDVDEALAASAPWFKARACHEYAVVRVAVQEYVTFDQATILDFGCGELPVAAASFALRHPGAHVIGTDVASVDAERFRQSLEREAGLPIPLNLHIHTVDPSTLPDGVENLDLVYSWSVFEHIAASELVTCFRLIKDRLARDGVFFFQISPLYHSPFGSHLKRYFPSEPWHHLRLSTEEVRARVHGDAYPEVSNVRAWQQFIELNRRSADDFMDAASDAGLELAWQRRGRTSELAADWLTRTYTADTLHTEELRALFKRK